MSIRATATSAAATLVAALAILIAPSALPNTVPTASAASCPAVEVIFARGRLESPGTGVIGQAFVSALRSRVNQNIGVYAVNYPADNQLDVGANDISNRIAYNMNNCPNTRLVLGGYSLGAAATDMVLAVPIPLMGFKNPMPAGADSHIAAVALFGNGTQWLGPITNFSPAYQDRTIELCHGADPICNPADPDTWEANWPDHLAAAYQKAGMINQAADFVAGKL
ncbi:putative cutinase cut2 [uncultured Mycobacterium sp.]|uniref:Cutinase n=1 Tax=uncultured Mycobacterium sp. TaxID=171292 RepID=A0A1Y5P2L5_9MYCO|nr:putative cutinase cut2 [uncultured Mycobacterium sp.]